VTTAQETTSDLFVPGQYFPTWDDWSA
jgi:hypothetical protein